jgi:hypothetical protein
MVVKASGTQLAVIGTEHSLNGGSFTDAGVYLLSVNTLNMVGGDTLELRTYKKVLSGDAQEYLVDVVNFADSQGDGAAPGSSANGDLVKISVPVPSPYSIRFTLKQVAGTGRNFPWRVDTI